MSPNLSQIRERVGMRPLIAAGLASSICLSAFMGSSQDELVAHAFVPGPAYPELAATPSQCIEPAATDYSAINHSLSTFADSINNTSSSTNEHLESMGQAEQFQTNTAQYFGLQLLNVESSVAAAIQSSGYSGVAQRQLRAIEGALKGFGITLEPASAKTQLYYGGKPPTSLQLGTTVAQEDVLSVVTALNEMPKELLALSGLKRIILMAGANKTDIAGYAVTTGAHDTIAIDISKPDVFDTHAVDHEIYHEVDAAVCGSDDMMIDKQFQSLNGNQHIYTGAMHNNSTPNYVSTYEPQMVGAQQYVDAYASTVNQPFVCEQIKKHPTLAAKVMSYSDYHPNPAEDKAELGATIIDPTQIMTFAPQRYTVMRKKLVFLLARLHHMAPAVANYLITTGEHYSEKNNNTGGLPDCA